MLKAGPARFISGQFRRAYWTSIGHQSNRRHYERGAPKFFEVILTAGRYRIGSDHFSFKIEASLATLA
jgi:hypothetical protein